MGLLISVCYNNINCTELEALREQVSNKQKPEKDYPSLSTSQPSASKRSKRFQMIRATNEKNMSGIYSDDLFKEQNKIVEDKIKDLIMVKKDELLNKYNLEEITQFIKDKFVNLPDTYKKSTVGQIRVLLGSIFPRGLVWDYQGYSNSYISAFYQSFLDIKEGCYIWRPGPDSNWRPPQ